MMQCFVCRGCHRNTSCKEQLQSGINEHYFMKFEKEMGLVELEH